MKPIVFLDFDGVIMTQATYSRPWTEPGPVPSLAYRHMDPALVANVDALCEAIGAEVVLSTAWRPYDGNRGEIRRALRARGLRAKVVTTRRGTGRGGKGGYRYRSVVRLT